MVLPVKPIADSKGSQVTRNGDRRQSYFGIIRADNSVCQEKRRAVCSWYGYGTIKENSIKPLKNTILLENQNHHLMTTLATPHATTQKTCWPRSRVDFLAMPELKSLVNKRRNSGSGLEADSTSPLVQNKPSSSSAIRPSASLASLKKCEMLLASTGLLKPAVSTNSTEKIQPMNRLRVSPSGSTSRLCSRCSSLLTLASSSRYSLNVSTGGFEPVTEKTWLLCKLCLTEVPSHNIYRLKQCNCSFCMQCMKNYVEFEIAEGAYDISCPDAQCPSQGVLQLDEIEKLVGSETLGKHKKYRLNREVELDKSRTWCPRAGCETVCDLCPTHPCSPHSVHCPTCTTDFCSSCKLEWHPSLTCDENAKKLAKEGKVEDQGIPFDSDLIKCCPMCNVPIEKDEGCAQMMCKRCKHVFCWYCLASLDDDFLLRHYDKGPCKNKLGHSRASVIWHRTQVIGIFAGLGILLLVASPLLLLAAPCIVCCKCRVCNPGNSNINNDPEVPDDQT